MLVKTLQTTPFGIPVCCRFTLYHKVIHRRYHNLGGTCQYDIHGLVMRRGMNPIEIKPNPSKRLFVLTMLILSTSILSTAIAVVNSHEYMYFVNMLISILSIMPIMEKQLLGLCALWV